MKRAVASFTLLALLVQVGGCSSERFVRVDSDIESTEPKATARSGVSIRGFVDSNGLYIEYRGHARIEGDSIRFVSDKPTWPTAVPGNRKDLTLPRSAVQSLTIEETSVVATLSALAVISALVAGVAVASCPFLYSYDGVMYVLDGEPYGGAISRGLERTDWSELEHLHEVDGAYRLRLGNEMDETQYVSDLALMVVDHGPGSRVVMDLNGVPHAFVNSTPLVSARDATGRDLRPWLSAKDWVVWEPDLQAAADDTANASTRAPVELEFVRPAGVDRAWLIADVATAQWGSFMIRSLLELHGDQLREHYATLDSIPFYRAAIVAWQEREELFHLFVHLQEGREWTRQGFVPGGGPFVGESRAVPIDLSGVIGDRVRIRLEPPIGFWSLNSFRLAWDEADVITTLLTPYAAVDGQGQNVLGALATRDDVYFEMPTTENYALVRFSAPPPVPSMTRSIFAVTRGWYEIHLDVNSPRNEAALSRLRSEPGAAVRMALEEYRQYVRSGKLRGTGAGFRTFGSK